EPSADEAPASERAPASRQAPPGVGRRIAVTLVACALAAVAAAVLTMRLRSPEGGDRPAAGHDAAGSGLDVRVTALTAGGQPAGASAPGASGPASAAVVAASAPVLAEPVPSAAVDPEASARGDRRRAAAPNPGRGGEPGERPARPAEGVSPLRARLESRARSGRASPDELQMLLGMCQREGDARCIVDTSARLRRAEGGR
ncbi:MAG TPA: hypothetical protein VFS00_12200, partial [Polyangiaceae bacterium]|nr:hypothetical protein [Polyangiaceae bacterium]